MSSLHCTLTLQHYRYFKTFEDPTLCDIFTKSQTLVIIETLYILRNPKDLTQPQGCSTPRDDVEQINSLKHTRAVQ